MGKLNYQTVTATVIDEDTIRYGGSFFKRERMTRYETHQEPEGDAIWDECELCGVQFGWERQYRVTDHFKFCPGCGARVERDV